jgi:hypothetical protein
MMVVLHLALFGVGIGIGVCLGWRVQLRNLGQRDHH